MKSEKEINEVLKACKVMSEFFFSVQEKCYGHLMDGIYYALLWVKEKNIWNEGD